MKQLLLIIEDKHDVDEIATKKLPQTIEWIAKIACDLQVTCLKELNS